MTETHPTACSETSELGYFREQQLYPTGGQHGRLPLLQLKLYISFDLEATSAVSSCRFTAYSFPDLVTINSLLAEKVN